jgi:hypothetical protein
VPEFCNWRVDGGRPLHARAGTLDVFLFFSDRGPKK